MGVVHPDFVCPALTGWLKNLPEVPGLEPVRDEVAPLFRCAHPPGIDFPVVIRVFRGKQAKAQAARAYENAVFLFGQGELTPRPVGWGPILKGNESGAVLVSAYLKDVMTLQEALLWHYYEVPLCRSLMALLQVAATAIRLMHASGFLHGGLSNQTILVQKDREGGWERGWVTHLDKGSRRKGVPDASARGRDQGCLQLPSDFRRVFHEMQYAPDVVPDAFLRAAGCAACHRHRREAPQGLRPLPPEQDIWIWDDRSMQAIPALRSKDKRKYYEKRDLLRMGGALMRHGRAVTRMRDTLMAEAWTAPVALRGRFGLSVNVEPDRFEKERRWLTPLGPLPLLVRLYHHAGEHERRYAVEAVRKLTAEGHKVVVALVQDRRAVLYPEKWAAFVEDAAGALSGFVEAFEVGHAVNRVKWGIWNQREYRGLLAAFTGWADRFPQLPLWGPAGIDFELPRVLPCLDGLPAAQKFSAFSHHMYVDRRGAPEAEQSGYDLVRKLALARAVARVHPACEDRLIVSEVNWPLKGTGVWSPVGSPYESPGERHGDPSVDEETYAAYMIRYDLLAVCSGMAERVYWWNLAAHGFGLIDDRGSGGWRPRPAYHAFRALLAFSADRSYVEKTTDPAGRLTLRFQGASGEEDVLRWDPDTRENPLGSSPEFSGQIEKHV